MAHHCPHPSNPGRPRTAADAVVHPIDALLTIGPYLTRPLRHESFALLLDRQHRSTTIVHHGSTMHADDVFELAADTTEAAAAADRHVVLLSARPHGLGEPADADRWVVLDDLFHGCGLTLVEWFVQARSLDLPRARAGVASRWPTEVGDRHAGCSMSLS